MHVKVKSSLKQPQHFFSDSVIVQCSYETVFWDNITSRSEGILVFSEVQTRLYGTQTALERMERLTLLLSSEHRASSMKFGVWVNKQKKDETLLNLSKRDWYSNLLSFLGGGGCNIRDNHQTKPSSKNPWGYPCGTDTHMNIRSSKDISL